MADQRPAHGVLRRLGGEQLGARGSRRRRELAEKVDLIARADAAAGTNSVFGVAPDLFPKLIPNGACTFSRPCGCWLPETMPRFACASSTAAYASATVLFFASARRSASPAPDRCKTSATRVGERGTEPARRRRDRRRGKCASGGVRRRVRDARRQHESASASAAAGFTAASASGSAAAAVAGFGPLPSSSFCVTRNSVGMKKTPTSVADEHPAEDGRAQRVARGGARARRQHQRHHADDESERGHQDRPEAQLGALAGRVQDVTPLAGVRARTRR